MDTESLRSARAGAGSRKGVPGRHMGAGGDLQPPSHEAAYKPTLGCGDLQALHVILDWETLY